MGEDPCVKDKPCSLCDNFSDTQRETLSTPSYRIRKERKAGLLVSPKEVTVISPVEDLSSATVPADNSSAHISAHSAPDSQPSAQVSTQAPASSSASTSDTSYVTSDQFSALSDKMSEPFARFEALLSRGNIFSAPTMPVNPVSAHYPQASAYSELPYDLEDSDHYSVSEPDEGELSDTGEKQEVTEDMNYRETVLSVRSFMGWNHIPVFESDFNEPDKSNNPWKGKVPRRPARVSVAMPPED